MSYEQLKEKALADWQDFTSPGNTRILIGTGTCGLAAGADEIRRLTIDYITSNNIEATLLETGCLGLCYAEPLMELRKPNAPRILFGNLTPDNVIECLDDYFANDNLSNKNALAVMEGEPIEDIPLFTELPMIKGQLRVASRNFGIIDPENINHYIARGGYSGLHNAIESSPENVIKQVKESGLRGRGGAGFPTGMKWEFCNNASGDKKYMICNGDEGDPGAFMDRSVLESDPHSVIEGMIIAAYAIGANEGYIYVRAEYPLAIIRLAMAIKDATELKLLGSNILGSKFSFDLHIKKGAGAFVCGEETALIASTEGKRGMPRSRPPFPANSGLFGKPSNINNVETLANVPVILQHGSEQFAANGTEKSRGTKTFALTGKIERTGLIEVPLGITLREIIFDIGGGIPGNKKFKAV
jgi:NADH-quinone oxidoreductase subunit F